ncbi:hypothetical protein Slin15195_G104390 [Septoria linicola]|uniref:DUF6536 domain-containing protein n=1 Tax=Septoria linicola TaxID=215465 RepID=A0A9Q9ENJ5_9PEZI|nr:hypothetical protein Slin14017_G067430 [Septoria linicola]USW57120.1 hypothetical protein Slin15195_G104390 [Septoria linicola]
MQCTSASTKDDLDRARSKGYWMDIGISSLRNLILVKRSRAILWTLLSASSIPLHLFYNAAVFKTINANAYSAALVSTSFGHGGQHIKENLDRLANLTTSKCIDIYSSQFVSDFASVVLITPNCTLPDGASSSGIWWTQLVAGFGYERFSNVTSSWICDTSCTEFGLPHDPKRWRVWNRVPGTIPKQAQFLILHCLAETMQPRCRLQFSIHVLAIVCVCNLVELACIFAALRMSETIILSIGDAVETFLHSPLGLTKGTCLLPTDDVTNMTHLNRSSRKPDTKPRRRYAALSKTQIFTPLALLLLSSGVATTFLAFGLINGVTIAALGFGRIDSRAMVPIKIAYGPAGFMKASFLANSPQLVLSSFYCVWINCFTTMHLASEWSKFAIRRKALRVTAPKGTAGGQQRSTYWLQLPLRYSIPMISFNAILHWLTSLAIFPVQIDITSNQGTTQMTRIGYSCAPIVAALAVAFVVAMVSIALSLKPLSSELDHACCKQRSTRHHSHHTAVAAGDVADGVAEDDAVVDDAERRHLDLVLLLYLRDLLDLLCREALLGHDKPVVVAVERLGDGILFEA